MPASSVRIAVAVVIVGMLGFAGVIGWQQMRPADAPVQLATFLPAPVGGKPASSPVESKPSRPVSLPAEPAASAPMKAVAGAPAMRLKSGQTEPVAKAPVQSVAKVPTAPAAGGLNEPAANASTKPEPLSAGSEKQAAKSDPAAPSFDIVRVEPSGDALLAGRSKPGAPVALVAGGKIVAQTKADAGGNFVMTPPTLKPGNYSLSLRQGEGAGTKESKQSVVVSVPVSKKHPVVVALAEPGKATDLLSAPPDADTGAAAPTTPAAAAAPLRAVPPAATAPTQAVQPAPVAPKLAIRSVELENGSGLFASGVAPPGTDVRIYLNDSHVADVIAAAAGSWTMTVRKGLTAGRYAVRADSLNADKSVASRVEVPFDVPPPMAAEAAKPASEQPLPAASSAKVAEAASPAKAAAPPVEAAAPSVEAAAPPVETAETRSGASSRPSAAAASSAIPPVRVAGREAETPASAGTIPASPQASPANVVVDELQTELVTRGDNLWAISRKRFGHGIRYTEIYASNAQQIRDPKLIYPGQVFVMPRRLD